MSKAFPIILIVIATAGVTYHVSGGFLRDNAAYSIRAEITQVSDGPPQQPMADEFGIQIVPEFPISAILVIAAGIATTKLMILRKPGKN